MVRDAAIAHEKAALRAKMIALRRSLPEKLHADMSTAIAGYIFGLPEIVNTRHVSLYFSIPAQAEVDTTAIVEGLSAMGKEISVPVIRDGSLCSAAFRQGDPLRPAQFGQPEPEMFSMADESELDVVLLPLLAFDASGYRLGYGKGFYDRFLQRLSQQGRKVSRIGLSFSFQMVDEVPADQWDETLDGVVHEQGIIRFA